MDETTAGTSSMPRRTILHGGAWTVPVIASAVAAPFAAASTFVCPTVTQNMFVTSIGNVNPSTGDVGWSPTQPGVFNSQRDNSSTSAGTANWLEVTIPTVAGRTYNFNTLIYTRWGIPNNSSARQTVVLLLNNVEQWRGDTRGTLNPGPNNTGAFGRNVSYTATSNGTVKFTVYLWLDARGGNVANDDVAVRMPTLTCS